MANSTQFSVAIHILCFLEFYKSGRITSELLATSVNANPAVIRRLMRKLTQAGFIVSTLGTNANITLARPANQLTLLDVYRAIEKEEQTDLFNIHKNTNLNCPVGSKIPNLLTGTYTQVQTSMEKELSVITIEKLAKDLALGISSGIL
ncbi:transcriptional regulator [Paenibacillus psychroresistens]|uniref:Transcriptional regulator n=1 Tax=Paenibacillus psychroresistens TaxID=1778678 RepID=A0A6B8RRD3_9BACL|nr:Rrf2 family transcriptional regulator [Paenibacillus psychroresistens]QGQ98374.1 transcriptional regulator [Paenibacillus psychroresistens]